LTGLEVRKKIERMAFLRTYQNKTFDPHEFHAVKSTLRESIKQVCDQHHHRPFLSFYAAGSDRPLRWTYADFFSRVGGLQSKLDNENIPATQLLVTVGPNTPEHLVILLGAYLRGHPIAMLDPEDPTWMTEQKLQQLNQPHAVFTSKQDLTQKGHFDFTTIQDLPPANPRFSVHTRPNQAVQVFTSGSTGSSEIALLREEGLLANAEALIHLHDLKPGRRVLTPLPVFRMNCFSFSFLANLLAGGELILTEHFDLGQFLKILEIESVHIASVAPHILVQLEQRKEHLPPNSALDYFLTAAAPLSPDLAKRLVFNFPYRVIQGYGLSQAVNFSLTMPPKLSQKEYQHWMTAFARPSLGTPVDFNSVQVWGPSGEVKSAGEVGELVIRGWKIMDGYLGDSEQACFQGEALHTGDLGFFQTDALGRPFFFITGRSKEVIKRMGETVSLVEIDNCLMTLGLAFEAAIAVPFANKSAGEEIAIVIQLKDSQKVDTSNLVESLKSKLAEKSWPRVIAFTQDPVRTSSGKASRWKFRDSFAQYHSKILGKIPILHKGDLKAHPGEDDPS
jgi:acyl-CoA synthetase (AMP-forming)/AMP-acid ligase II